MRSKEGIRDNSFGHFRVKKRNFQNMQIFERLVRSQMIQQRPQLHNAAQLQSRPLLQNVVMVSLYICVVDCGISGHFFCTPSCFVRRVNSRALKLKFIDNSAMAHCF